MRIESRITREILETILQQPGMSVYNFGSSSDGTTTEGMKPDLDTVRIFNNLPVVINPTDHPEGSSFLFVQDSTTPPGYCKLQLVKDGVPQYGDSLAANQHTYKQCGHIIHSLQYTVDQANRLVCSFEPGELKDWYFDERHGPALTRHASAATQDTDFVIAVECNDVTSFIPSWLNRARKFGWPTDGMLQNCKSLGCLFVPVGHPLSDVKMQNLQWRISCSQQEKKLVTNFNPVQHKCFIVLKMVKKEIIQKIVPDSLSSYHIKTCMLFAIENTPSELWKPENLLVCVSLCLRKLLEWVQAGYCPNYFIPEENMFDRRIRGTIRTRLRGALQKLVLADCMYLPAIQSDGLGRKFLHNVLTPCDTTGQDDANNYLLTLATLRQEMDVLATAFSFCATHLTNICDNMREPSLNRLLKSISSLRSTTTITRHTVDETQKAKSLILPYLELALMSNVVAYAADQKKGIDIWRLLASKRWRELRLSSDPFSSRLKQAALLHMLGYYKTSLDVLSSLTGLVRYTLCSHYTDQNKLVSPGVTGVMEITGARSDLSSEYLLRNVIIPCIYFLPTEENVTPVALCYEMRRTRYPGTNSGDALCTHDKNRGDWAFVDGNFLLHFLIYLNHKKLNTTEDVQFNIDLWKAEMPVSHTETCYNLIGWVFKGQGKTGPAELCFTESLRMKPHCNAAFAHMVDLLYILVCSLPLERLMNLLK